MCVRLRVCDSEGVGVGSVSAGGRYDQEHVFGGLNWGEEVVDKLSVSTLFITMTDRILSVHYLWGIE